MPHLDLECGGSITRLLPGRAYVLRVLGEAAKDRAYCADLEARVRNAIAAAIPLSADPPAVIVAPEEVGIMDLTERVSEVIRRQKDVSSS
jgi:hypothetical protein